MKNRKGAYRGHSRTMQVFPCNFDYLGLPEKKGAVRAAPLRELFALRDMLRRDRAISRALRKQAA